MSVYHPKNYPRIFLCVCVFEHQITTVSYISEQKSKRKIKEKKRETHFSDALNLIKETFLLKYVKNEMMKNRLFL